MIKSVGIAGGGFGGIAAAYFLRTKGISCRVFDQRDGIAQEGGSITVFPNGMKILAKMGLAEAVANAGAIIENARFLDQKGNFLVNRSMGLEEIYGVPTVTIRRRKLLQLMYEQLVSSGAAIEFGKTVQEVSSTNRAVLKFADGTVEDFDFVIGADGVHSSVRECISGGAVNEFSNLIYFGGIVERAAKDFSFHQRTQYVNVGKTGFFAYSYIDGESESSRSILWYCYFASPEPVKRGGESERILERRAKEQFGSWCEPVPELVEKSDSYCIANVRRIVGLERWSKGRIALIGDAAHALSPVSGQGASLAMEDAELLAHLAGSQNFSDFGSMFSRYEGLRRERVSGLFERAERSSKLMMISLPRPIQILRNLAFSAQVKLSSEEKLNGAFSYSLESFMD